MEKVTKLYSYKRVAFCIVRRLASAASTESEASAQRSSPSNHTDCDEHLMRSRTEQILHLSENSSAYLKTGQYEEAFGLLQTLYELGPDVQFANVLVESYVTAMATNRPEKARKLKEELHQIIAKRFNVDADDVCRYAMTVQHHKHFFKAILFFQIYFTMFKNDQDCKIFSIHFLAYCVAGLSEVTLHLLERKQLSKLNVKKHILSQVYEIMPVLESKRHFDRKKIGVLIGLCWQCIALNEKELGGKEKEIDCLRKAVIAFHSFPAEHGCHNVVLGECLKRLAVFHINEERFREAAKAISDAIDAIKRSDMSAVEKYQEVTQLEKDLFLARTQIHL